MGKVLLLLAVIFFALIFDRLNIFLFLLCSSILHELGHMASYGILVGVPNIKATIFGIKLKSNLLYGTKKVVVLASGPFVNFIIIIICQIMLSKHFYLQIYIFMCVNLVIMLFNLLPISFLDGGQILSAIIDNYYIEKVLNIGSLFLILSIIIIFSADIYYSLCAISIFLIYFILNTLNDI